jgi:uncharacterized protein YqiB (DUF1249 family)
MSASSLSEKIVYAAVTALVKRDLRRRLSRHAMQVEVCMSEQLARLELPRIRSCKQLLLCERKILGFIM